MMAVRFVCVGWGLGVPTYSTPPLPREIATPRTHTRKKSPKAFRATGIRFCKPRIPTALRGFWGAKRGLGRDLKRGFGGATNRPPEAFWGQNVTRNGKNGVFENTKNAKNILDRRYGGLEKIDFCKSISPRSPILRPNGTKSTPNQLMPAIFTISKGVP